MGVCGCGKTAVGRRLAEQLGAAFVDADDLHPPENKAKMSAKIPLTDEDRWPWLRRVREAIDATPPDRVLTVACSALKRAYRHILTDGAQGVRIIHLKGSEELIASRLAARKGHFMPPDLLRSQLATLEEPGPNEACTVEIDADVGEIVRRCLATAN